MFTSRDKQAVVAHMEAYVVRLASPFFVLPFVVRVSPSKSSLFPRYCFCPTSANKALFQDLKHAETLNLRLMTTNLELRTQLATERASTKRLAAELGERRGVIRGLEERLKVQSIDIQTLRSILKSINNASAYAAQYHYEAEDRYCVEQVDALKSRGKK
ncbi:hypothetical protein BC938DRAFT_476242 [Jimgerdemannia flammicorona]|uniref:Uncharacterized protein n=1 Tax=Jimgerdemannia flammicorona TaxID=994334 RepID=A0A433PIU2_9FUNG|nr:hypothetical protein BC938DRAFT_476242 [Jimgerdemannia flammicorona]